MNTWWRLIICEGITSEKTGIRRDEVMDPILPREQRGFAQYQGLAVCAGDLEEGRARVDQRSHSGRAQVC